jgi:hypothetical protein
VVALAKADIAARKLVTQQGKIKFGDVYTTQGGSPYNISRFRTVIGEPSAMIAERGG